MILMMRTIVMILMMMTMVMMMVMTKTLGMTMADKWCNEQSFVHQSGTIANMSCTLCTLCTQSHFKITLVLIVAPVMQKYKRN